MTAAFRRFMATTPFHLRIGRALSRGSRMTYLVHAPARPATRQDSRLWAALVGGLLFLATLWPADARARGPESLAELADQVMDAVVNISAATTVEARGRTTPQLPPGTPF